jgi:phage tail-like protein
MPIGDRSDPLLAYNFQVSLLDSSSSPAGALTTVTPSAVGLTPVGGLSECSGLEGTLEVQDHQEDGLNGSLHRFRTRIRWSNLTLKRGVGRGLELWSWFYGFAIGAAVRKDGVITLLNERHEPHMPLRAVTVSRAWSRACGTPSRSSAPSACRCGPRSR